MRSCVEVYLARNSVDEGWKEGVSVIKQSSLTHAGDCRYKSFRNFRKAGKQNISAAVSIVLKIIPVAGVFFPEDNAPPVQVTIRVKKK
jgi:hypothetical protein